MCALSMSWCQRVGGANERGWPLNFCDILGARNAKGGGGAGVRQAGHSCPSWLHPSWLYRVGRGRGEGVQSL